MSWKACDQGAAVSGCEAERFGCTGGSKSMREGFRLFINLSSSDSEYVKAWERIDVSDLLISVAN